LLLTSLVIVYDPPVAGIQPPCVLVRTAMPLLLSLRADDGLVFPDRSLAGRMPQVPPVADVLKPPFIERPPRVTWYIVVHAGVNIRGNLPVFIKRMERNAEPAGRVIVDWNCPVHTGPARLP